MPDPSAHPGEPHYVTRSNWLRAAVLGANDGIVSVSSLIVGVAAADASQSAVIIAGVAGLSAGAMSMAAGEDVCLPMQIPFFQAHGLHREGTEQAQAMGFARRLQRCVGRIKRGVRHVDFISVFARETDRHNCRGRKADKVFAHGQPRKAFLGPVIAAYHLHHRARLWSRENKNGLIIRERFDLHVFIGTTTSKVSFFD